MTKARIQLTFISSLETYLKGVANLKRNVSWGYAKDQMILVSQNLMKISSNMELRAHSLKPKAALLANNFYELPASIMA